MPNRSTAIEHTNDHPITSPGEVAAQGEPQSQPQKTYEQIKELKELLQLQFDRMPIGCITLDLAFHVQTWNPAAERIFGFTALELTGKHPYDFIVPPKVQPHVDHVWRQLMEGNATVQSINRNITKDGRTIICDWLYTLLKKRDGTIFGVLSMVQDITKRKLMEIKLMESEEKFRSVVDNIGIGVALISPRMEILTLNQQMRMWFPRIDAVLKPICYKSFNHPPRENICSYCPTAKTLEDGLVHEAITDTPIKNTIKNYRVVSSPIKDQYGKIIAAVEMVEDITERLWAEEEVRRLNLELKRQVEERKAELDSCNLELKNQILHLEKIEIKLRKDRDLTQVLLQGIPFGLNVVDEKGCVLFLNHRLKTVLGKDVIGRKCWSAYKDDGIQCAGCPLKKKIGPGQTETMEVAGMMGGRIFQITHTGMVFQDKKAILEVFQDITGHRRA